VSVRRLLKADRGASSRLSEVEVASALIRRAREGAFALEERDRALAALENDFTALILVELTPEITADARALLLRHRLRAGDGATRELPLSAARTAQAAALCGVRRSADRGRAP
jgi:predicted nucleic acid-binding protein